MSEKGEKILQQLSAAIKSVGLYPPDHPSRRNPLVNAFRLISTALEKRDDLEIAIREQILIYDDEPVFDASPALQEFQERLQLKEVTLLRFHKGFEEGEIGVLLELLAASEEELQSFASATSYLHGRGVNLIEVEQEDENTTQRSIEVYSDAKNFMVSLWAETRTGNLPNGDTAKKIAEELNNLIRQDRSPLMGLTMLSDYDNYTFNHSVNVGVFAMALAQEVGLTKDESKVVGLAGLLHDVGKTQIPIEIINKPGKLDAEEWEAMKAHPVHSGEIVTDMGLTHIYEMVRQHHCGYNRQGYPFLSVKEELHDGAMLTAVADVYDSMTTTRPYQRCHTPQEAIDVLLKLKDNGHLRPDYVEAFLRTLGIFPVGTCVRIDDGSIGFVNAVYRDHENRPVVKIFREADGGKLVEARVVNLQEDKQLSIVGTLNPAQYGVRPADFVDPGPMTAL